MRDFAFPIIGLSCFLCSCFHAAAQGQVFTLEQRLLAEGAAALAADALAAGDARRGAVLYYQGYLACRQCHPVGEADQSLGPGLAPLGEPQTPAEIAESILQPSKQIRRGFDTYALTRIDGQVVTGLLQEETAAEIVLRDASPMGPVHRIAREQIDALEKVPQSIMPAGLVNQLNSRQQFLDLLRYVIDITAGGAPRAAELEPPAELYAAVPLPTYEAEIDHAGLIRSWDDASFERGKQIYERLCINCHGTPDRAGSLPTSPRFGRDSFKNGHDPLSMYQTLTRGFGMMMAQTWMVPRQKYDVIHYIREAFLQPLNASQYVEIDADYLARLPEGNTLGPEPSEIVPWEQMNYGPNLIATYEVGEGGENIAYKGNAIRLDPGPGGVSQGRAWMLYDLDTLRVAGAWSGTGFIDWNGINFNGRHGVHPRVVGNVVLANSSPAGWAHPIRGDFREVRLRGRDGKPYGPLPRDWAHYRGMYYHGHHVIVEYTVGDVVVREMPAAELYGEQWVFQRIMNLGPRPRAMCLQVAQVAQSDLFQPDPAPDSPGTVLFGQALSEGPQQHGALDARESSSTEKATRLLVGVQGRLPDAQWEQSGDNLRLRIPAGEEPLQFAVYFAEHTTELSTEALQPRAVPGSFDLTPRLDGGPARWSQRVTAPVNPGRDDQPLASDVLTRPVDNPWFCQLRLTGLDFFPGGDVAAICSWDGSVWLVRGLNQLPANSQSSVPATLQWQRIASGLFQPLGLKIIDGEIFVTCRDQICVLHDLNGDHEVDFYESFNNDHQVTEHFHEFAMGLQVDQQGNLYYAKSARHALPALVPHHGTLLRVSSSGDRTDVVANGFRAANGVCLNPDGTFIVTDQEGHWNPKNRINWVEEGGFYGNMFGYHDVTDSSDDAMQQPLCWITNEFDRSPSELLWVESPAWKPLQGSLLNLSYGYGKVYVVPFEEVGGQKQGGMSPLPLPNFPTGIMRGRFHPTDGQLYVCGMFAWAGNQQQPGGLYRIRYTGRPLHVPIGLSAEQEALRLTFSDALSPDSVRQAGNFLVKTWALKRTANYGSEHYNEQRLAVEDAILEGDGKTVRLTIPQLAPTWCMEIRYRLRGSGEEAVEGVVHNTIYALKKAGNSK